VRVLREKARSAALRELKRSPEVLARLGTAICAAQGGAEVCERVRMFAAVGHFDLIGSAG
jgi:hypothetical protein